MLGTTSLVSGRSRWYTFFRHPVAIAFFCPLYHISVEGKVREIHFRDAENERRRGRVWMNGFSFLLCGVKKVHFVEKKSPLLLARSLSSFPRFASRLISPSPFTLIGKQINSAVKKKNPENEKEEGTVQIHTFSRVDAKSKRYNSPRCHEQSSPRLHYLFMRRNSEERESKRNSLDYANGCWYE